MDARISLARGRCAKRLAVFAGIFALLARLVVDAGEAGSIFSKPTLLKIELRLGTNQLAQLRERPRDPAEILVVIDGEELRQVSARLKGGEGSFRPLDEKPGWTLDFNKHVKGQTFAGLTKIHLNNSVQDSTYLCEDISGELFRRAGVPAPRVAWAMITLNGRNLGLYVVKEGITKGWLQAQFGNGDGNLYDSGTHREVSELLRLDSGRGPADHSDLQRLTQAATIADSAQAWKALNDTMDRERFISFMACEILANHIDGYCLMQNNYRIYFADGKRATFLPQGMDRMFWEPKAPLRPAMKSLVAAAVMKSKQGEARYNARIAELAARVLEPAWITNRMNAALAVIGPVEPLAARDAEPLRARILERISWVRDQAGQSKHP